jgi:L-ascorbate metabolism protein UlaG (beta-lactamase superfamily)
MINIGRIKITLLRHATVAIDIAGKRILVDPMLSPKDTLEPVQNCGNDIRFPMVDLPISDAALTHILSQTDAVIVTHLHRDHWDVTAQNLIHKNMHIICQPNDKSKIEEQGFKNVQPVSTVLHWEGLTFNRTGGQHGTGEIGDKMGPVSGFVISHDEESIYIAGDTIWCSDVENALLNYSPKVTILNAGGARFLTGDPITMTPEDIVKVHDNLPGTKIIAVHMDTVNHCFIKRPDLRKALEERGLASEVLIPRDGEVIIFDV